MRGHIAERSQRRSPPGVSAFCITVAACVTGAFAEPQPRATIDASSYPNLQAALDAVPDAGGIVRLPPGTFELAEPLVLTCQDMRIEGSGAATHLVNRNEEGKAAVVVRPSDYEQNPRSRL